MRSPSSDIYKKQALRLPPMNPRLRLVLFFLAAIALVTLIAILAPRLIGLYFQAQGAQKIDQVIGTIQDTPLGPVACDLPIPQEERTQSLVLSAASSLQQALRYDPRSSHSFLLLGRAYCLAGEPESAVNAYLTYTQLRPNNPLGHLELAFAYEAFCRKTAGPDAAAQISQSTDLCNDSKLQALIIEHWKKAGVVVGQFIVEGDQAFARGQYAAAERWYQRGAIYGETTNNASYFKWSVASVLNGLPLPDFQGAYAPNINVLNGAVQIEAEDLYWLKQDLNWNLRYGDRLIDHPSADPNVGVMWWPGAAVAFVQAPEDGFYRITLRALDSLPGPIKLQIERDLVPIDQFKLSDGDQTWKELTTATVLKKGLHIIGINFVEDQGDAVLDWVRIQKMP